MTGKRRLGRGETPPTPPEPTPSEPAPSDPAPSELSPDESSDPGPSEPDVAEPEPVEPAPPVDAAATPPPLPSSAAPVADPADPPVEPEPEPGPGPAPAQPGWAPDAVGVSSSIFITPMPTRREARAERRRQFRKRVGLAGGAAIVAVVLIIVAATAFGVHKAVAHHHTLNRTQTTLLFQIRGADNTASGSVLLAHDPAQKQGVEVLIPPGLPTDVCGYGTETFGKVLALPDGESSSRAALTTMLNGVTVDGSWIVTSAQLAALVDDLGGVTVDVDTNVVHREASGVGTILVPAGTHTLTGTQAVEYATYLGSASADESAELARLQQVVDATIRGLPASPTAVAALIRRLGPQGASSLGVTRLSALLAGLRGDYASTNGVFPTDLPYTTIDAGSGGAAAYRVDSSATGVPQLVKSYLAQSVPPGAGNPLPTVFLLNGVGNVGLVTTACPKLTAHGLAYAGSNNAASFTQDKSVVAIKSDNDVALGDNVARALGLPTADVELSESDQSIADVIVTLGSDYKS